jgi:hypothetical protein
MMCSISLVAKFALRGLPSLSGSSASRDKVFNIEIVVEDQPRAVFVAYLCASSPWGHLRAYVVLRLRYE